MARQARRGKACCGKVRYGVVCQGMEWQARQGKVWYVGFGQGSSWCVKAGKARSSMAGLVLSRFGMAGTAVLERNGRYGNEMVVRI